LFALAMGLFGPIPASRMSRPVDLHRDRDSVGSERGFFRLEAKQTEDAAMTDGVLTVCGPGQAWQVSLNPRRAVIGRSPDCDVLVDSPEGSQRHARILRTFQTRWNRWVIRKLRSTNG
jgi:hypothetical protein